MKKVIDDYRGIHFEGTHEECVQWCIKNGFSREGNSNTFSCNMFPILPLVIKRIII